MVYIKDRFILPPMATDFAGAVSFCEDLDLKNILLTPGGCDASFRKVDCSNLDFKLLKTRFNDITLSLGVEDKFIEAVNEMNLEKEKIIVLGTPVINMLGINIELVKNKLKDGVELIYLDTDGFSSYKSGISKILNEKSIWTVEEKIKDKIQIIGYNKFSLGDRKKLDPAIEALEKLGYIVEFLEDSRFKRNSEIDWILTPEAEFINTENKKRIYGLPIGEYGVKNIISQITGEKLNYKRKNILNDKVLIIGEYATSIGIADSLYYDLGYENIELVIFSKEIRDIKKDTEFRTKFEIKTINDLNSLSELINEKDLIIGDPLIQKSFDISNGSFISIPYVGLSGKHFLNIKYEIVGERGLNYLKDLEELKNEQ